MGTKKVISLCVAVCLLSNVLFVAGQASQLILSATIRDQAPAYMTHNNFPSPWWTFGSWTDFPTLGNSGTANGTYGWSVSDFELPMFMYGFPNQTLTNGEYGLFGDMCTKDTLSTCGKLGSDGTPVYRYPGKSPLGTIQSPESFQNWFHDTPQAFPIPYNFTFDLVANTARTYAFSNDNFFPIDGQGWNDQGYDGSEYHNFAFCCQLHSYFTYLGGEIFNFTGDDDMIVYIGGYLVIDLGGVHTALNAYVALDSLGFLTIGVVYSFDMFYCERHTTASNIAIATSLELQCPGNLIDRCGVCGGNGQSCCTPADVAACNDHSACTNDTCGITQGSCAYTPIVCTAQDKCHNVHCDNSSGCVQTTISCDDSNVCTIDTCNPATGCVHTPTTCPSNACFTGSCDPVNGCQYKATNCGTNDKCTTYSCNNSTGCSHTTDTCNDNDPCTIDSCDPVNGCSNVKKNCTDNNPCTTDICVESTGQCSNTPIDCSSADICSSGSCVNGVCVYKNLTCASSSNCDVGSCPVISKCSTPQKSCDTGGCVYINKSCDTGNPCSVGYCDESTGSCASNPLNSTGTCVPCGTTACLYDDPCNPQVCSNGKCVTQPFNCTASTACATSKCVSSGGVASCQNTPVTCSSSTAADACTSVTCDNTLGCINATSTCDDYNPCTLDTCLGKDNCSNVVQTNLCDDNNVCTVDVCNSTFSSLSQACQHNNISCTPPTACQVNTGCDPTNGCTFTTKTCPTPDDFCTVAVCDNQAGCVTTPKSCVVTDPDCYVGVCDNVTKQCTQQQRSGFNTLTTSKKGGVTCLLAYNKKAVAALTAGAIAGIAIGGAVAVAAIGFGGKKGYDLWLAHGQGPNSGVHPNPLYTQSAGTGHNPGYN